MIRERKGMLQIAGAKPTLIFENKYQGFVKISLNDTDIKEAIVRIIYITRRNKTKTRKHDTSTQ